MQRDTVTPVGLTWPPQDICVDVLAAVEKADGTRVPMWHDSEVAAIADNAAAPLSVMGGKKCSACGAPMLSSKKTAVSSAPSAVNWAAVVEVM